MKWIQPAREWQSFWIYDPAICLDTLNTMGYPARGPKWGLENPSHVGVLVGIDRSQWVGHCVGYSQWCTLDPTSPWWFQGGVRGDGRPFAAGRYKWQVTGTYNDITFRFFDTNNNQTYAHTYDETTPTGWAAAFGYGWRGIYLVGDAPGGPEAVKLHVSGGDGVFTGIGSTSSPVVPYKQTTWGAIKALCR